MLSIIDDMGMKKGPMAFRRVPVRGRHAAVRDAGSTMMTSNRPAGGLGSLGLSGSSPPHGDLGPVPTLPRTTVKHGRSHWLRHHSASESRGCLRIQNQPTRPGLPNESRTGFKPAIAPVRSEGHRPQKLLHAFSAARWSQDQVLNQIMRPSGSTCRRTRKHESSARSYCCARHTTRGSYGLPFIGLKKEQ